MWIRRAIMAIALLLLLTVTISRARRRTSPGNLASSGGQSNLAVALLLSNGTNVAIHTNLPNPALLTALRELRAHGDALRTGSVLQQLARNLLQLGRPQATAEIRAFLIGGEDAPTGLSFALAEDGFLAAAPTLRVFLLDLLGRLDPRAAAEFAATVLAQSNSADEWAIALRDHVRTRPEARDFQVIKMRQLLGRTDWQANPSPGYLEAFDVAVQLGGRDLLPELTGLLSQREHPAAARAASLALDRLVSREPAIVLNALLTDAEGLDGREATRAGYFARADVRDPAQRSVLESYLLDAHRTAAELDAFAGVYPNASGFVSNNLLTRQSPRDGASLRDHDRVALSLINQWLSEPRFQNVRPSLTRMQARLREFVGQVGQP